MPHPAEEYLKGPYTHILVPDEMGGYYAEILEFPGCFAQGESPNETIKALDSAAAAWIHAALAQGQDIPPPFRNEGYGGKIALRLPKSMHKKAVQFAEYDGISLNQFLISAVAMRIGAQEVANHLATQVVDKIKDHLSTTTTRITNITIMAGTPAQQLPFRVSNLRMHPVAANTLGDTVPALN